MKEKLKESANNLHHAEFEARQLLQEFKKAKHQHKDNLVDKSAEDILSLLQTEGTLSKSDVTSLLRELADRVQELYQNNL